MSPTHFDTYLRSITSALLALGILGVAAWQLIATGHLSDPLGVWAGLVIGVYFGSHVSLNGSLARRAPHVDVHVPPPPDQTQV